MRRKKLQNVVWKEGKYWVAQCLNVDVSSFGDTKKEALEKLDEALGLYFEDKKVAKPVEVKRPEVVKLSFKYV